MAGLDACDTAGFTCYLASGRHDAASRIALEAVSNVEYWIAFSHLLFFIAAFLLLW